MMDVIGDKYNRLTVVSIVGKTRHGHILCECECECGTHKIVQLNNIRSGHTKSCGCLDKEQRDKRNAGNTYGYKHGHSAERLYREYRRMIERCRPTNKTHHERYYDRGITVCQQWVDSMEEFINWAKENGYDNSLTLDRIDNDKGYSPENCRWVTQKEQLRNRSVNRNVTYNGMTMCVSAWAEYLGVEKQIIYGRLRIGWPIEAAFFAPVGTYLKDWLRDHPEQEAS